MRIYLIGMPGSGKTTVGQLLAKQLNFKHIDIDNEVEKDALMFIDEIIETKGLNTFRDLETKQLKKINEDNLVISCGGGIVENKHNKKLLDGHVIYLNVDNKIIEQRLVNDYPRPLLTEYTLEELYKKRFLKYLNFATKNISNEKTPQDTVLSIIKELELNI